MSQFQKQEPLGAHDVVEGPAVGDACHLQTHWQQRGRGSLPLKKRRFGQISTFHPNTATDALTPSSLELESEGPNMMGCKDVVDSAVKLCSTTDGKISSLALVAAATTSSGRTPALFNTLDAPIAEKASVLGSYDRKHVQTPSLSSNFVHDDQMGAMVASGDGLYEELLVQYQHQQQLNSLKAQTCQDAGSTHSYTQDSASDDGNQPSPQQETCTLADDIDATPTATSSHPRQRTHHPPLSSPLPGGCHGRTSRNNSYCRRTPCYNFSKYCKLHYQQYVVQGSNPPNAESILAAGQWQQAIEAKDPVDSATDAEYSPEVILSKVPENSYVGNKAGGGDSSVCSVSAAMQHRHHQDKRYNGLNSDEVQCQATTTRGRPCAYVAASGCKYCNLHADYDTNPPPRRGGSGGGSIGGKSNSTHKIRTSPLVDDMNCTSTAIDYNTVASTMMMATSAVGHAESLSEPATPLTSYSHYMSSPIAIKPDYTGHLSHEQGLSSSNQDSIPPMISYREEPSKSKRNSFLVPPKTQRGEDLPLPMSITNTAIDPLPSFPLLSSIPSDQWSNKLVLISTGPLVNHTGRVLKWGNGWITVRAATGGCLNESGDSGELLHNRRAIELYLLPDEFQASTAVGVKHDEEQNDENQADVIAAESLKFLRKDHIQESNHMSICSVVSHCEQMKSPSDDHRPITADDNGFAGSPDLQTESDIVTDCAVRQLKNDVVLKPQNKDLSSNKSTIDNVLTELDSDNGKNSRAASPKDIKTQKVQRDLYCTDNLREASKTKDHEEKTVAISDASQNIDLSTPANASETHVEPNREQNLTLIEELILAQTGRRVQNLDLIFDSGGARRTIHRPERYEDKAMIEKKRHRQHHGLSPSESDHEGTETNDPFVTKKERLSTVETVKTKKKVPTNEKLHIRLPANQKALDDGEESKDLVLSAPPTPNNHQRNGKIKV